MAAKVSDIQLITEQTQLSLKSAPHCEHGPTLLFERFDQASKTVRQFYACAAFRDRKACSFFQWHGSESEKKSKGVLNNKNQGSLSHHESRQRYRQFKQLLQSDRHVCCTCGQLLLEGELSSHRDKGHDIKSKISVKELRRPTSLFSPLDNNKTYAQFLFSKTCVDFIVNTIRQLGFTHVICVGAPRIHEEIQVSSTDDLKSILLDLDDRYAPLYPPSKYAKYNMFNHYFFDATGKEKTAEFLSQGQNQTLLVTDPPFGGMVEALAASFKGLSKMWEDSLVTSKITDSNNSGLKIPTMWFFPYFMESRIVSELPGMTMLDYKVAYDNHSMYKNNRSSKGSPVRIFTNLSPSKMTLPVSEGYWFCDKCQRFSSKENHHCNECGSCTSKDGTTYKHCDMCMRCVKPSRVHCFKCQQCDLENHVCGVKKTQGCHICGELDHKRRDCPQKHMVSGTQESQPVGVAKRKKMQSQGGPRKKKKKPNKG